MNSKNAFWQALIFTIIIFIIGIIIGFFLENYRSDKLEVNLINSEINLIDLQLRNDLIGDFNISCQDAKESTFNFADMIYFESSKLEVFESNSKFTKTLFLLHKRYDLLRMMLWNQAMNVKNRCEGDFHIVVYLYEYNVEDIDQKSKQAYFSRALFDLKQKYPEKILLIPMAANTQIESINLVKDKYFLYEFPVIIIDNEKVLYDIESVDELENRVFKD